MLSRYRYQILHWYTAMEHFQERGEVAKSKKEAISDSLGALPCHDDF